MGRKPDLVQLIDRVYEAAVDFQAWPRAMTEMAESLRAREMVLEIYDPAAKPAVFVVAPRDDPQWPRVYVERWAASNFLRERSVGFPVGALFRFEDLVSRSAFDRTPLYNEFFAPQGKDHALSMYLAREGTTMSAIGFYRALDKGPFRHDEHRLLQLLGPHLQRAVALNLRLARIEMQRDSTAEILNRCAEGALLVDAQARILFANRAAEALLRDGAALQMKEGRLAAATAAKTAQLRGLIAGIVAAGSTLALPSRDGTSLAVLVMPLKTETTWLARRPAAIVFVKDPKASTLPSRARIQLLFNLTPAQAAVAREILQGDGIQAAAERLNISRATARTHLLEVFQRTGTGRQAELVRVILQATLPAHPKED